MMRSFVRWATLGLLLVMAACAPVDAATRAAAAPSPIPTNTATPESTVTPTLTATATIVPTLQPTPLNPADCRVDSCTQIGSFWLRRPVDPPAEQHADDSYLYGSSQNGKRIPHSGVEFYNATGTPVLAAAEGRVAHAGSDESTAFAPWTRFYGNLIVLEHTSPRGEQFYTLYAHLSEIAVHPDEVVQAGQVIGKVGMSGSAIGSHLHFEVRTNPTDYTTTRNPFLFLSPLASPGGAVQAALAGQVVDQNGELVPAAQLVAERLDLPENSAPERYYIETYTAGVSSDPAWQENFVLSDLEPGRYRISFVYDGRLIERFVTLSAGQITYLSLQVEN